MSRQRWRQTGAQQGEFNRVTEATAEVIMLPPEPPISRSPPDFNSRMAGVMEEGGRSPVTAITLHIRSPNGLNDRITQRLRFRVCVGDFTCPQRVRPPAEIRQLVVEDDACPRGVNGSSKSKKKNKKRQNMSKRMTHHIVRAHRNHLPAHNWFMVLVAETASPSSSRTDTCVVPKQSEAFMVE